MFSCFVCSFVCLFAVLAGIWSNESFLRMSLWLPSIVILFNKPGARR